MREKSITRFRPFRAPAVIRLRRMPDQRKGAAVLPLQSAAIAWFSAAAATVLFVLRLRLEYQIFITNDHLLRVSSYSPLTVSIMAGPLTSVLGADKVRNVILSSQNQEEADKVFFGGCWVQCGMVLI